MKKAFIRLTALLMAFGMCTGMIPASAAEPYVSDTEEAYCLEDASPGNEETLEAASDELTETEEAFLASEDENLSELQGTEGDVLEEDESFLAPEPEEQPADESALLGQASDISELEWAQTEESVIVEEIPEAAEPAVAAEAAEEMDVTDAVEEIESIKEPEAAESEEEPAADEGITDEQETDEERISETEEESSGEDAEDLFIQETQVESISAGPVQIQPYTHGYYTFGEFWNEELGMEEEDQYFRYNLEDLIEFTVEYAGNVYSGTAYELVEELGLWIEINSSQGPSINQWAEGNTYTATATLQGKSCEVEVTIMENLVQSLSAEPVQIPAYSHGDFEISDEPDEEGEWFRYDLYDLGILFTVEYNGNTYTETADKMEEIAGSRIELTSSQSLLSPWTSGNTYIVTATLQGKSCEVEVTIMENLMQSISAEPVQLIAGTGGCYETDSVWNENVQEMQEIRWYHYYPEYGDIIYTVVCNGITYRGTGDDIYFQSGLLIELENDQDCLHTWEAGNTYTVTASLQGKSCEIPVTILESQVESISAEPVTLIEKTHGYMTSDSYIDPETGEEEWKEWYNYSDVNTVGFLGITFTIVYNGETYRGTEEEIPSELFENIDLTSDQSVDHPWTAGNTYTITATLQGKSCEIPVTIQESLLQSISAEPGTVIEYTCGSQKGTGEGYEYDPRGMDFPITIVNSDGSTFTGTYEQLNQEFGYEIRYHPLTAPVNTWTTGNTYEIEGEVVNYDLRFQTSVTVVQSPLERFTAKPVQITEFTCGRYVDDYTMDEETGEWIPVSRYYYDVYLMPLEFSIIYDGVSYTGTREQIEEATGYPIFINVYDVGQDSEWTAGNTYTFSAELTGKRCGIPVTIVRAADYEEPTYTWSSDNRIVTAKRVNRNDSTDVEEETAVATYVATPATCTTAGKTEYTALFTNSAFETQTKTVTIAAAGHQYKTAVTKATLTKDGSVEEKCSVCGHVKSSTSIPYPKTIVLTKEAAAYNGKAQKPSVIVTGSDGKEIADSNYTVTFSGECKDAGSYTVTVSFKGNYTGTKTLVYKINAKTLADSSVTLSKTSFVYTGKAQKPSVTVKDGAATLKKGTDYDLKFSNNRKTAGTYKATVTFKGNYSGKVTKTFKITRKANPIKISSVNKTVSYSKVKKKTQKAAPITVKKAKGPVTYKLKKTSGSSNFTIDKSTGKITIKKGTPKGTYKLKVIIKAAGDKNYKASGKKTVSFKITVK